LDYRATSIAESASVMIRRHLPGTDVRLPDLRRAISSAYSCRRRDDRRRLLVSNEVSAIISGTGLNLEANIIEIMEKSFSKSKRMVTEVLEDERIVGVDRQRCYMVEASRCECGYSSCWALPCPHLILVHQQLQHTDLLRITQNPLGAAVAMIRTLRGLRRGDDSVITLMHSLCATANQSGSR
jgi:hypothetical protein